jgi:hypothetical protein
MYAKTFNMTKRIIPHIKLFSLLVFMSLGCNRSVVMPGAAAFTIVNAIQGSNPLITNFQASSNGGKTTDPLHYFNTAAAIGAGSSLEFGNYSGTVSLALSQSPDTLTSIWNGQIYLPIGSIQTLFLSGDTLHVDTLLTTDAIPYYPPSDSAAGVRFINLSKGSLPMTVNIQGNAGTQTEFSDLGYRQISNFKGYSAVSSVGNSYNFEIRDQATDSVLTTFTWYFTLQKSVTLVIYGAESTGLNVFTVNDY